MDKKRPLETNRERYEVSISPLLGETRQTSETLSLEDITDQISKKIGSSLLAVTAVVSIEATIRTAEAARRSAVENLTLTGEHFEAPEGHAFVVIVDSRYSDYTFRSSYFHRGSCSMGTDTAGIADKLSIEQNDDRTYAFIAGTIDTEIGLSGETVGKNYQQPVIAEAIAHKDYAGDTLRKMVLTEREELHLLPLDRIPENYVVVNNLRIESQQAV